MHGYYPVTTFDLSHIDTKLGGKLLTARGSHAIKGKLYSIIT